MYILQVSEFATYFKFIDNDGCEWFTGFKDHAMKFNDSQTALDYAKENLIKPDAYNAIKL